MGRAKTRQADGAMLRPLTDDEKARYNGPRGATPRTGTTVALWRLGGSWSVWSEGPLASTWWLKPLDDEATDIVRRLVTQPDLGAPAVVQVVTYAIAVRSKDIRAGGWTR